MDIFQITVLAVAAIILILIFTTIGILTKYSTTDNVFPPIANSCPDNWTVNGDKTCAIPSSSGLNVGTIYTGGTINLSNNKSDSGKIYTPGYSSGSNSIDFSDAGWGSLGSTPTCAKNKWVNTNTINWDGISNYNACS